MLFKAALLVGLYLNGAWGILETWRFFSTLDPIMVGASAFNFAVCGIIIWRYRKIK